MSDSPLPFENIKHRSIQSAKNNNLIINISSLTLIPKIFTIIGIIFDVIGYIIPKNTFIRLLAYIFLFIGSIFFIIGVIMFFTLKYKFIFNFEGDKLNFTKCSLLLSNTESYLISNLDYIIIDQIHVENDDDNRNGQSISIGDEQNGIQCKIIINSINKGVEEVFSGSGQPPLFTNDEVQFFNQFMKVNINRQ